jgi:hypothetical protein
VVVTFKLTLVTAAGGASAKALLPRLLVRLEFELTDRNCCCGCCTASGGGESFSICIDHSFYLAMSSSSSSSGSSSFPF